MSRFASFVVFAIVAASCLSPAYADLTNGNFENGLTGWSATVNGSAHPITVSSGTTTTSAGTIAPSLTNDHYVYTSQSGPGSSFLTQTFLVQPGVNKIFFDIAINNAAGSFYTPDSLDYTASFNQQARFDIIRAGAPLDTTNPSDIIVPAFQTHGGDPQIQGWRTYEIDATSQLAPYVGQNVVFRFAQVDNQGYFNFVIDNVNVGVTQTPMTNSITSVPLIGTVGLFALSGLLGLLGMRSFGNRRDS